MPHSWEMDCTIGLLVAKSGPDVSGSKNIARPVAVVHHLEPPGGFRRFSVPISHHRGFGKSTKESVLAGDSKGLASCGSGMPSGRIPGVLTRASRSSSSAGPASTRAHARPLGPASSDHRAPARESGTVVT